MSVIKRDLYDTSIPLLFTQQPIYVTMTSKFIDFTKDKITQTSSPEKTTDRTAFQTKATKSVDVDPKSQKF